LLNLFKNTIAILINFLNRVLNKNNNKCCIIAYPEFDDATKNLVSDAKELGIKVVILTNLKNHSAAPQWSKDAIVFRKYSIRGIFHFCSSSIIIFTHNHFPGINLLSNQLIVNIWHGMPIKDIGLLDSKKGIVPKSHYGIASGPFFKDYLAKAFGLSPDMLLPLPHPRLKSMYHPEGNKKDISLGNNTIGFWLPTYRKSIVNEVRTDGDGELNGIGIKSLDFSKLNEFLLNENHILYIKPHPMSELGLFKCFGELSNIKVIDSKWFEENEISLYSMLGHIDYLVTDISSVYFDFKLLNKPVIIAFSDKNDYLSGRCQGGIDYNDVVTEKIVTTQEQFESEINSLPFTNIKKIPSKYIDYCTEKNVMMNFFTSLNICISGVKQK
jgi:CDP-glycerol glycerophosphotransferase (TagB/SpsB family)